MTACCWTLSVGPGRRYSPLLLESPKTSKRSRSFKYDTASGGFQFWCRSSAARCLEASTRPNLVYWFGKRLITHNMFFHVSRHGCVRPPARKTVRMTTVVVMMLTAIAIMVITAMMAMMVAMVMIISYTLRRDGAGRAPSGVLAQGLSQTMHNPQQVVAFLAIVRTPNCRSMVGREVDPRNAIIGTHQY